jgi:hypothetical protein
MCIYIYVYVHEVGSLMCKYMGPVPILRRHAHADDSADSRNCAAATLRYSHVGTTVQ